MKVTTACHHAEILELKNTISRNISELCQSQRIHMPGLTPILDETRDNETHDNETHDNEAAEDSFKLWLPSELSVGGWDSWCLPDVPALEFRFHYAQADDSLAELRRLRRLFQGLLDQNKKHPSLVQKSLTRTQGLFKGFQAKIRRFAGRYSHAWDTMLALDPDQKLGPGWMQRLQKLNESDIRGPGREPDDKSEGRFIPSWIWLVPHSSPPAPTPPTNLTIGIDPTPNSKNGVATASDVGASANNTEAADSMRVHWAKCQARAERYEEEVVLTIEEMGRTLCYFEWKESQWLSLRSE